MCMGLCVRELQPEPGLPGVVLYHVWHSTLISWV